VLAMGRGLMSQPKLTAFGPSLPWAFPILVREIFEIIREIMPE